MYRLENGAMDAALAELRTSYRVFAPKKVRGVLRYGEISSVSEIVLGEQTAFSPKEIYYPIVQTMLYFSGGACKESEAGGKPMIVIARPCDINAIRRLDKIFLENGGAEDTYYARLREKVKIFMLECRDGFESCFCASMGGNSPVDYAAALRFENSGVQIEVRDQEFVPYFSSGQPCDFTPEYPSANAKKLDLPEIREDDIERIHALPFWDEAAKDCVGCGGCNAVCGACSCNVWCKLC